MGMAWRPSPLTIFYIIAAILIVVAVLTESMQNRGAARFP
jgi:hypothetical protein